MKREGFRIRAVLVVLVVASWVVLLVMMWGAYRTLPTAEQLSDARVVRPPLPIDWYRNLLTSAAETALLTILLWPWWQKRYLLRVLVAMVALVVWFFLSVPMDLNTMEWLHRRWLALMVLLLLVWLPGYPLLNRRGHGAES